MLEKFRVGTGPIGKSAYVVWLVRVPLNVIFLYQFWKTVSL